MRVCLSSFSLFLSLSLSLSLSLALALSLSLYFYSINRINIIFYSGISDVKNIFHRAPFLGMPSHREIVESIVVTQ